LGAFAVEGFNKALTAYVPVPLSGEVLVLGVQAGIEHIVVALYRAGVLLDADVIISPVLCEATDYVKRSLAAWPRRSIHEDLVFALFNIVPDSSYTDIWSARGDYGTVIEEGAIARRVRGSL
jgi:hypothetical protein